MKKLSLPIRFGIVISGGLIASFSVACLFNAHTNPLYSMLNIVVTGFGIFETIRYYKLEQADEFFIFKWIYGRNYSRSCGYYYFYCYSFCFMLLRSIKIFFLNY